MYINAVVLSDQLLATNNVLRKCLRWWKTLFFRLIVIAVVKRFLLLREHQANNPDDEELKRPKDYSIRAFRTEIIRESAVFRSTLNPLQLGIGHPNPC